MSEVSQRWRRGETSLRVGGDGGESPAGVAGRVLGKVREVLRGREGRTVLLVCHSWVNKALIASVMPGMGLARMQEVPQRNCAVNVLDFRSTVGSGDLEFRVWGIDLTSAIPEGRL